METATSRTGLGVGACRVAVLMRAVTAVRFARRAEARAGTAAISGVVIEVEGVVWVQLVRFDESVTG